MNGLLRSAVIQIFASDLRRSLEFYRLLGLPVPDPSPPHPEHVLVSLPSGNVLSFDTEQTIAGKHPGWIPQQAGGRLALAFRVGSPAEVDTLFAKVTGAGHARPLPPYDAPWDKRAVDVEEIGGQERGGVGAQEDAPGSVVPRWRRDAVGVRRLAGRSLVRPEVG